MKDLTDDSLGWERINALVERSRIAHDLTCPRCGLEDLTAFWLAVLGWTPVSFMIEAFPEFYGGGRG
jgi:hypothetical protein